MDGKKEEKAEPANEGEPVKKPGMPPVPIIENIHQKLLEAVTNEQNVLDMSDWHRDKTMTEEGAYCGTTHCRAGWIVVLAGKEGRELEKITDTEFAAKMIYKASSPIHVGCTKFFEDDATAMLDIERCAAEEKELANKTE